EPSASQTECLVECGGDATVSVLVRFLHLQRRRVLAIAADGGEPRQVDALTVDETEFTSWDEAIEREQRVSGTVAEVLAGNASQPLHVEAGSTSQDLCEAAGRTVGWLKRSWTALDGVIRLRARRVADPYGALKLSVRIVNQTRPSAPLAGRDDALGYALIAAH